MSEHFNGVGMEESDVALWYVVHTFSGYENKVASSIEQLVENRGLQDMIQEVRVPTEIVTEIHDGVKKDVEHKVFPGYVLVKMVRTNQTWYLIRTIRGCTGFVGPDGEPIALTEDEVERMGVVTARAEAPFKVGDSVKVVDGHLEGFIGTVNAIDLESKTVELTVSMFNRETSATVSMDVVVPLD